MMPHNYWGDFRIYFKNCQRLWLSATVHYTSTEVKWKIDVWWVVFLAPYIYSRSTVLDHGIRTLPLYLCLGCSAYIALRITCTIATFVTGPSSARQSISFSWSLHISSRQIPPRLSALKKPPHLDVRHLIRCQLLFTVPWGHNYPGIIDVTKSHLESLRSITSQMTAIMQTNEADARKGKTKSQPIFIRVDDDAAHALQASSIHACNAIAERAQDLETSAKGWNENGITATRVSAWFFTRGQLSGDGLLFFNPCN